MSAQPHSTSLHLTPPHSTSLHLTPPHSTLTPPHSTSLHLTPPQKRGLIDLYISTTGSSVDNDCDDGGGQGNADDGGDDGNDGMVTGSLAAMKVTNVVMMVVKEHDGHWINILLFRAVLVCT